MTAPLGETALPPGTAPGPGEERLRVDAVLALLNDVAVASAHHDPVALLEAAVGRVCETLGAQVGAAYLRDADRLLLVAGTGMPPECARAVAELALGEGAPGRAISELVPVAGDSGEAFGGRWPPACPLLGTVVAVPLLAKARAVGAVALGLRERRPFSPGELKLLSAIGVQLGVAVDAARLFAGVTQRASDLEAVNALALRIFEAPPGDVRALLEAGCRHIAAALSCRAATVFLADAERRTVRGAGGWGVPHDATGLAIDLERDWQARQALERRVGTAVEDVTRDARSSLHGRADVPPLAMLAVPLGSRGDTPGVLLLADTAGRSFSDAEIALATALGGGLGVGLENARLYADASRRVEELSLLHEVGRSLVESLDIEHVLETGVRNLTRIVDTPEAYLSLASPEGTHTEIRCAAGSHPEMIGLRLPLDPPDANLVSRVFHSREPLVVEDALTDPRINQALRARTGGRGFLALPLVVRDRSIGAVVILDPRGPRRYTPAEVQRAAGIANQLAVAAENARLYEDLRRSYAELERAQHKLVQRERLAALGELSAVVAHEVRNPLGVIFNSVGSLRRLVRPAGDAKLLLDIVGEEAERLNRIVGDLLDFARPSTPDLRPERIERVVEEAVGAALQLRPAAVEIARELDPDVPPVPLDARLVRQAILNVAVNAVQAMPRGGRMTLRTRREGDAVVLEVEDTGCGIPEEVRSRIFEPFFTTKASGTGLGLAVVKRIVEGHGGSVAVRSRPGDGAAFVLTFPLGGGTVEKGPAIG